MFYLTSSSSLLLSSSPLWLSFIALYRTWCKKKNLIQQGKLAGNWFIYDNQNYSFSYIIYSCCSCYCNKIHACWINVCIHTCMCGYTISKSKNQRKERQKSILSVFLMSSSFTKNRRQIRWEEWQRERVRYRTSCGVLSHCLCHYLAISWAAISAHSVWFLTATKKCCLLVVKRMKKKNWNKKEKKNIEADPQTWHSGLFFYPHSFVIHKKKNDTKNNHSFIKAFFASNSMMLEYRRYNSRSN